MAEVDFPLFPLGLVALPSEQIPLHIFEAPYRTMISRCLESGGEFGILSSSGETLAAVGCACIVEHVLERMEDGRMNIVARGTRPFALLSRQDELPFPAGTVEFLEDELEAEDAEAGEQAREAYARLVEEATDSEPDPLELAAMDAYAMAATVEFGAPAKQQLLELRSERLRLRLVTQLVRAALKRLEFIDRAQTRARSNGKVRFG
ncbi:MAG: LON peptidase substrate-binding domain-containing protein [Solirubrobacteraceae bacterium]